MITYLKDITTIDVQKYGRKASALGELMRNGISIPSGFALSSNLYDYYMQLCEDMEDYSMAVKKVK